MFLLLQEIFENVLVNLTSYFGVWSWHFCILGVAHGAGVGVGVGL